MLWSDNQVDVNGILSQTCKTGYSLVLGYTKCDSTELQAIRLGGLLEDKIVVRQSQLKKSTEVVQLTPIRFVSDPF